MTEQEAILNLELLTSRWEDDEEMYHEQMDISIDQEFVNTLYTAIKALEEVEQYRAIGTVEECRAAVEKQKEMIAYCDENDCVGCPYHNVQLKENRCMNDFIADEIMKGG